MKYSYKIINLDCPVCAKKIENHLKKSKYFEEININFNTLTLNIKTNYKGDIIKLCQKLINQIDSTVQVQEKNKNKIENKHINKDLILLFIGIIFMILSFIVDKNLSNILIVLSYIFLLYKVFLKAVKKIFKLIIDEDTLVIISCIGAYFTNNVHEGLMVIILYDLGKILESAAVNNSRKSISDLMDIKPEYAHVMKEKEIVTLLPEEVKIDDTIVIKPGEKIPLDGVVIEGNSKINTQSITGESKLKKVSTGDTVLSGTINAGQVLYLKVTNNYESSTVSKILTLMDEASERKAPVETKVERLAKVYTPAILVLAIISIVVLPQVFELSINEAIYRALTFLVISCPCAIALSVPLSYFSGLGTSSKHGILIKGSNYLDAIGKIKEIIFDKTGTISKGQFTDYTLTSLSKDYSEEEIIRYYISGETLSSHPIAKSILNIFKTKPYLDIQKFKEISGKGIQYEYKNKLVKIGSNKFCNINSEEEGIYLNIDNKNIARLVLKDEIKANAKTVIEDLKKLDIDIKMYTGDNLEVAKDIATRVSIDKVYHSLLPQDKFKLLEESLKQNESIAFVGDGINDAPSLALAKVGISMGVIGSDAAIEASDIVIVDDDLRKIKTAISISRYTNKIINENLIFAISTKILVLLLSFFGVSSMWHAVFADTGVTLLAILNSTRILKKKYN